MGGSSKSVTVGYKYYVGMHLVLCHGPIDKLLRVQVDERTVWQGSQAGYGSLALNQPDLFGGESREGGIVGQLDFEPGAPTQGQNSYLLSKLGNYVAAYRGVVGIVLRQMYMGLNPYLKSWRFRISRIHTRQNGIAQWYDAKSEIQFQSSLNFVLGPTSDGWKYKIVSLTDGADYSSPSYDDTSWASGQAPFASQPGHPYAADTGFPPIMNTNWPINTKIWVRRKFDLSSTATFRMTVFVDNYATVWVNGVKVLERAGTIETPSGPVFTHDFQVPGNVLQEKDNVIVVMGEDYGTYTYCALKIIGADLPQYDMNPAHIIRECLTDPNWGMGYAEADVDETSFRAAADVLYDEQLGMSIIWDTQTSIEEFVKLVIKHANASLYVDRKTGKFVLKLIRQDYDVNSLIVLDPSNIDKLTDFVRPTFGELTNSITVSYWDAEIGDTATLTIQDIALSQMQGATIGTSVTYEGLTNADIASRVAQRDLKTLSTPLAQCTIETNRIAENLNIGDCFKLTWPDYDLDEVVMRVVTIAYGNGKTNRIRLTCVQDVFAMPDTAFIPPVPPDWVDPSTPPVLVADRSIFEVPYLELVQLQGQQAVDFVLDATPEVGYVGAGGVRPISAAINARMFDNPGSGYVEIGNMDFCPGAKLNGAINETVSTFPIKNGSDLDQVTLNTWLQVDNEIMGVTAISDTSITVKRGCLDTIPAKHADNAALVFWDNYATVDNTEFVTSDIVKVKLATVTGSGQLDLSQAPEDTVVIAGRAAAPYPPGQVRINGSYFPDYLNGAALSMTWVHRDRKQETAGLVSFYDGSIGPETGSTYTLELRGETNVLQRTYSGITGTSQGWATEADDCGFYVQGDAIYHNESFISGIPGSYATMRSSAGTGQVSWQASTQAVLLDATSSPASPTAQNYWEITSLPMLYDIDFEADMEIIADVTANYKHAGLWLPSTTQPSGYRFAHYLVNANEWIASRWPSGTWGSDTMLSPVPSSKPTFNLNERRRLRVTWSASTGLFQFFVDGVKLYEFTDTTYRQLRPAIFFYGCTVRLHEVKVNGHTLLSRLNNQINITLKTVRATLPSWQPYKYTAIRVGYGYSYGTRYGGL